MALTDDLIAHWKLDEASGTRSDSHGANHLADNNTVGSGAGRIGNAALFSSASLEYLSALDSADLSVTGSFTFAAWVNLTTAGSQGIIAKDDGASNREYYLTYFPPTPAFRFLVGHSGGINFVDATNHGAVTTGVWTLVVVWFDAATNTINIQVNNGTPNSTAKTTATRDGVADFFLGRQATNYFNGLIDSVSFWKRALTSDERTQLWNGGAGIDYEDYGGAVPLEVDLDGIASGEAVLALAVRNRVALDAVPTGEQAFAPTLKLWVAPGFVTSSEEVPALAARLRVTPGFVPSGELIHALTAGLTVAPEFLSGGDQAHPIAPRLKVTPGFVASGEQAFAPGVRLTIAPGFLSGSDQAFAVAVEGNVTLNGIAGGLVSEPAVCLRVGTEFVPGSDQVFALGAVRMMIVPAFIPSGEQFFALSITGGQAISLPSYIYLPLTADGVDDEFTSSIAIDDFTSSIAIDEWSST